MGDGSAAEGRASMGQVPPAPRVSLRFASVRAARFLGASKALGKSLQQISLLRVKARNAEARARLNRLFATAFRWAPGPLGYAAIGLTYVKVVHPSDGSSGWLLLGGGLLVGAWLGISAWAWLRRAGQSEGGLLLDHFHELKGRVGNALSFAELPLSERTPFMEAAILDAVRVGPELSPSRAVPWLIPRETPLVVVLFFGLLGLSLLEVRVVREAERAAPKASQALVLATDDVEYFKEISARLAEAPHAADVNQAIQRFNQLVLDIGSERLTRDEVFRRLDALERDLADASDAEKAAFEQALKDRASALKSSQQSRALGEALERHDMANAEKELKKLAEKVRQQKQPLNRPDLERLKKALEAASQQTQKRLERIEARRQELSSQARGLLNKKKDQKPLSAQEAKEQKEAERKLERLDREKREATAAGKGLAGLDKELAEAAQKLMKEAGLSAKDLEQGAEQMNRTAQSESSQQEKQQLKKRLEELRELLRQQGQAGKEQMKRLLRFGQRARGGKGAPGEGGEPGEANGKGQKGPITLSRGGPGEGIDIPGGPGKPGSPGGQKPGQSQGEGSQGAEYGTGHADGLRGDSTQLDGKFKDVSVVGADTGEGAASAEVIHGAAQRGFTGRGYSKVYTDYRTVAESVISKDEVPAGYRFYIRRYFQLIRPRE